MRPIGCWLRLPIAALILLLRQVCVVAAPDDVEMVAVKAQVNNQFFMNDQNLEANIFNPHGNAKQARNQIETRFKLQLNELHRICDLNDSQKQKLRLAASSDIKRFFDEVDAVLAKYRNSKHDQAAWNNIWQEISPLQTKMAMGLFGDTSFFHKTIRKTLSPEQTATYDAVVNERRKFRYKATIEVALMTLENTVPLRHDQHESLAKLLYDDTPPPASFGQYDQHVVMYHLANLPEAKLKSMLDERQWKLLQGQFNQYRGMEQFLIQNGLLPKENGDVKILKARVRRQVTRVEPPVDATEPENRAAVQPAP